MCSHCELSPGTRFHRRRGGATGSTLSVFTVPPRKRSPFDSQRKLCLRRFARSKRLECAYLPRRIEKCFRCLITIARCFSLFQLFLFADLPFEARCFQGIFFVILKSTLGMCSNVLFGRLRDSCPLRLVSLLRCSLRSSNTPDGLGWISSDTFYVYLDALRPSFGIDRANQP